MNKAGDTVGDVHVSPTGAVTSSAANTTKNITGLPARQGKRLVLSQGTSPTCGPTCAKMIGDTLGKHIDIDDISRLAKLDAKGVRIDRLAEAMKLRGLNAKWKVNCTIDDLANATKNGTPAIAHLNIAGGHFVVVDGVTTRWGKKVVAIRNPWGNQYYETVETFMKQASKQVVIVSKQ